MTIDSPAFTVGKMPTRLPILAVLVFILSVVVCSCTVDTDIRIHDDASGEAMIVVRLHPVAVTYMSDLSLSLGNAETTVFDQAAIERAFGERSGVTLREVVQTKEGTLTLDIEFDDVRRLFETPSGGEAPTGDPPVEFARNGLERTLSVVLSRSNFGHISGLFVMPESPLTVLLPYSEHDFMPQVEYLEVLEYAIEDYLDGMPVDELLEDKRIRAFVEADRDVSEITGGVIESGEATFSVPVLDVLTLEEDIRFSLSW